MWLARDLSRPGAHEERLRELFAGAMVYEADAPVFEHPLYVLGFTNRSGSNLLGEYLRGTSRFCGFQEQLNHPAVESRAAELGLSSFPAYVEAIAARGRGQAPFGVKASSSQLSMLLRCRIDRMFAGLRLIHIVREDTVAQAVSFSIAYQTKTWTSLHGEGGPEAAYSYDDILRRLSGFTSANALMAHQAALFDIPCLKVTYEALTEDPASVMRAVGRFAGVGLDAWQPGETRLRKQATDRNARFKERFERECRERIFGRAGPVGGGPTGAPGRR
ncbi:MAG TPA: Stf0 family sulfotransferase [Thermohalobaculum sp.]|nr:Stf0 family sulfotransferase [Thermohalobaculum sp.]